MAGYNDTKAMIISTLMGRPAGTEIQPEKHQEYALSMLEYIRNIELISGSSLIGVANEETVPVQPDNSRVSYIAGIAQNRTMNFQNFIGQNGEALSVTTEDMECYLIILLWNTEYWSLQAIPSNIISQAENATFYYRYNIRKTYNSVASMNSDSENPIGTDGKPIQIGDIVSVVNTMDDSENAIYSRTEEGWQFQSGMNFALVQETGYDPNVAMSQDAVTKELLNLGVTKLSDKITLNKRNYSGFYVRNVNTGELNRASGKNSYFIEVEPNSKYKIVLPNKLYASLSYSIQLYSGFPSTETNIGIAAGNLKEDVLTTPENCTHLVLSVEENEEKSTIYRYKYINSDKIEDDVIDETKLSIYFKNSYFDNFILKVCGLYCSNVNDGKVSVSSSTYNGYIAPIKDDELDYILTGISEFAYSGYCGFCYSGQPGTDTFLGSVRSIGENGEVKLLSGTKFFLISVKQTSVSKDRPLFYLSRIIKPQNIKDGSIAKEKLSKEIQESLESLNNSLIEVNNNNYLKNWEQGNKVIKRIFIENKELAIQNGLHLRQIFHNINSDGNSGINLGTKDVQWAISLVTKNVEKYEKVDSTYGKIAVWFDWEGIEWTTSSISTGKQLTETNFEDIAFDFSEFSKPANSQISVSDGSITEEKLSDEVKEKLNGIKPVLSGYELFSLGDSLSQGGTWQQKVSELTGCTFDQEKNIKAGAPLSVGGTKSYGQGFDTMMWRAKNLVDSDYINDEGEKAIIILENVNDASTSTQWDSSEKLVIPTKPIEGYSLDEFNQDLLNKIPTKQRILNACLRLTKTNVGKNLAITKLPSKEGDITLTVGCSGPGNKDYNIHVVPQSSDEETRKFILDKILEYDYTGVTDTLSENGESVDFSNTTSDDPRYRPTVIFKDTTGTGMTVSITDTDNAKSSVAKYFIGDSVETDWSNTEKWIDGNQTTFSMAWKSTIEQLLLAFPKAHIFVSMFPLHAVTAEDFRLPNGYFDTDRYDKESRMVTMRHHQEVLKEIANYYSLPFINIFEECGIGITNMLTYYQATANVHPKVTGYERFGETVSGEIKRFL